MSDGIKVIKITLPEFDEIDLFPVSDVHWEEPETDEKRFIEFIQFVLDKQNRFVVLNGDMMNMALTMSVSNTYDEKYSPSETVTRLANVLKVLVINNRILGMGTGNHEDRVYKYTGIDVSKYLAMESGLPMERYSDNSFVTMIKFGQSKNSRKSKVKNNVYSIFFHHGVGGGRMKGGKVNMVVRMNQIVIADAYVVGHVHDPILTGTEIFDIDYQNMSLKKKKQYYLVSNAWQKYGGYGQKFGFPPSFTDMTYMTLNGKGEKKIKLHLGL